MGLKRVWALIGCTATAAALFVVPGVGSAAQKVGCSNASSGWTEVTVAQATDRIWAGLLDTSPWGGDKDVFGEVIGAEDANGEGSVCLRVMWGEDLNPNSHWYKVGLMILGSPTEQFLVNDNNRNGSG